MEALIALFRLAETLVENELLKATSPSAKGDRTKRLAEIRAILTELRAKAVGTETDPGAAWQVIADAYREGARRAANDVPGEVDTSLGGIHLRSAQTLYEALADSLDNAIAHVGRKANDILRKVTLNEVLVGQLAGQNRSQTGKAIEENLRERGVKGFTDKAGREWNLTHYAKMAANSAAAEAHTVATLNRLAENGFDLVKVSEHPHKNDVCSKYEGKVFSISGTSDKYPPLKEAPPYHPFCKHVLTAYVELEARAEPVEPEEDELKPAVAEFVPARSIGEAEEWARENVALKKVDYTGIDLEVANDINAHLARRLAQYPGLPDKLDGIISRPRGDYVMAAPLRYLEIGKGRTTKKLEEIYDQNARYAARHGRPYLSSGHLPREHGVTVASHVDHELGHILVYNTFVYDAPLKAEWTKLVRAAYRKRELGQMSEYATKQLESKRIPREEAFAEAFELYTNGHTDLLPTGFEDFIRKVAGA